MKKTVLIFNLILLSFVNVFAQIDIKDYLDYENPDLKRQELIFDIGFQNNLKSLKFSDTSYIDRLVFDFDNQIIGEYTFLKNTRKYIGAFQVSLDNGISLYKSDTNDRGLHKSLKISPYLNIRSYNKFYFKDKWFLGLTVNPSYDLDFSHNSVTSPSDSVLDNSYIRNNRISVRTELSFGKGRIEDITDVIHSIVLLKNFKKNGVLSKYPSPDKIKEFSKFITQLKNKRFFDSRHKKIYELEQVDSFLSANNIIDQKDIKYFTTLEDIWVFGTNNYRNSGSIIELGFNTDYFIALNKLHYYSNNGVYPPYNQINLSPFLSYRLTKPINVKIQSDFGTGLGYKKSIIKSSNDDPDTLYNSEYNHEGIIAYVYYGYHYYPNTRTVFGSSIRFSYDYQHTNWISYGETYTNRKYPLDAIMSLSGKFYISPQVRFNINVNLRYSYIKDISLDSNSKFFNYFALAGFQISLK